MAQKIKLIVIWFWGRFCKVFQSNLCISACFFNHSSPLRSTPLLLISHPTCNCAPNPMTELTLLAPVLYLPLYKTYYMLSWFVIHYNTSSRLVASLILPLIPHSLKMMSNPESKGKAAAAGAPPPVNGRGWGRGVAIVDFMLRLGGIAAALAATIIMATTNQTLPFFTQFFQFHANYSDLPAFSFFVVANAIASGYLVLSLPFSIITIVRPSAIGVRLLLLALDTVMVGLTMAAAGSTAAVVYLAHKGNTSTNWLAICQQFGNFCQRVSGAVVASFIAALIFIILVLVSAMALRRN
ncbi:hypothetical protein Dimus_009354 [Dionaea muscipula]